MAATPMHTRPIFVDSLRKLLRKDAAARVANLLSKLRPPDVAALFKDLTEPEKAKVFGALAKHDPDRAALVLREFHGLPALDYLRAVEPPVQTSILNAMTPDDAVELIDELEEDEREQLLETMQGGDAREVRALLEYDEETAGRIMNPDYFAIEETATAGDAIRTLQSRGKDLEVPFYVYVLDTRHHLVGVLSLRQLLLAPPEAALRETMATDIVSVSTSVDQEEVARQVTHYDLMAIPVVDAQHKLVGVISIDDIIDVLREEATEDVYRLAGTSEDERMYRSVLRAVALRIPWLLASFIGGIFAARVINHFEETLAQIVLLAGFIPVILGMGGNIGTQCSTIIVRGLATGRIEVRELWRVLFRETRIALILGVIYGGLLAVGGSLVLGLSSNVSLLLGLSLFFSMLIAAVIGSSVPMLLKRINIDPAVATGPFITTSVDILAVLVFFELASVLVLS